LPDRKQVLILRHLFYGVLMQKRTSTVLAAVFLAASLAACATGSRSAATRAPDVTGSTAAIRATLDSTAAAWNRGSLAEYLAAYVPEATEMLATGPAGGVEQIEKTMKEGFWKTGTPLQKLRYEHVVVRMLGPDNALTTGQYVLSGADRPDRTGWFTTIWTHTPQGWRMIHDHS
jgi:uncharacterized protein (TIGR02246 family)